MGLYSPVGFSCLIADFYTGYPDDNCSSFQLWGNTGFSPGRSAVWSTLNSVWRSASALKCAPGPAIHVSQYLPDQASIWKEFVCRFGGFPFTEQPLEVPGLTLCFSKAAGLQSLVSDLAAPCGRKDPEVPREKPRSTSPGAVPSRRESSSPWLLMALSCLLV